MSEGGVMVADPVTPSVSGGPEALRVEQTDAQTERTLKDKLAEVEKQILIEALVTARGNRAKAARALGMTERVMGLRVKKYGINARQFRNMVIRNS